MEPRERNEQFAGEIAGIAAGIKDELSTDRWKKPVMRSFGTPGLPSFLKGVETLIRQSIAFAEATGDSGMIEGIDNAIRRLSALITNPDSTAIARGGTDIDTLRGHQRIDGQPSANERRASAI